MERTLPWVVAAVVGGLVGTLSHVVGASEPLLTAGVVCSYVVLTRLAFRHPDVIYEEDSPAWAVGRWSGLSTGFVLAVVFLAVGNPAISDPDLRLSLEILVFGVGWAMWTLGVAYAREKDTI